MAYISTGTTFGTAFTGRDANATPTKPGVLARIIGAITTSRETSARREIARHAWLIDELKTSRAMTQLAGLPF
jgi:hypothetical protein